MNKELVTEKTSFFPLPKWQVHSNPPDSSKFHGHTDTKNYSKLPGYEPITKHRQSMMISLHPLKELWRNLLKNHLMYREVIKMSLILLLSLMNTFFSMHSFVPMLKDLISKGKSCVTKLMNDHKHIFLIHRIILRCASVTQHWKLLVCLTPPNENISSLASNHSFHSLFQKCLKRLILPEMIGNSGFIFTDMQIYSTCKAVSTKNAATTEFCCLLNRCHSRSVIFPFACSPVALLLLPPEDTGWWSSSTNQWTKLWNHLHLLDRRGRAVDLEREMQILHSNHNNHRK